MTTLRNNFEKEMRLKGWNAYDLANKSGVPQPTIQRFLKGKIGDPRANTVRKLAHGLGTTEAALRGFVEVSSHDLLDKFDQLCADHQREVSDFINFKLSQNKDNIREARMPNPESVKDGSVMIKKETRPSSKDSGYIEMIKNKCKENQCYCETPCDFSPQEKRGVYTDFHKAVAKIRKERS